MYVCMYENKINIAANNNNDATVMRNNEWHVLSKQITRIESQRNMEINLCMGMVLIVSSYSASNIRGARQCE